MVKLKNEHLLQFWKVYKEPTLNYTIFADTHIPFEDEILINKALKTSKGDILIIAGDLIDGYSASYYPKDKPITFNEEIEKCQEYMYKFSKRFDKVYICLGNHDYRIIKQLENLPFGIVSYVKQNVLEGFLNAIKVKSNIYVGAWWLLFINSLAIAHADTYSVLPLRPVLTLQEYIAKMHPTIYQNLDAILQGHTHHLGLSISYYKMLIQLPCMQKDAPYRYKDRLTRSINYEWQLGWLELSLDKNGRLIKESIKFKY